MRSALFFLFLAAVKFQIARLLATLTGKRGDAAGIEEASECYEEEDADAWFHASICWYDKYMIQPHVCPVC